MKTGLSTVIEIEDIGEGNLSLNQTDSVEICLGKFLVGLESLFVIIQEVLYFYNFFLFF